MLRDGRLLFFPDARDSAFHTVKGILHVPAPLILFEGAASRGDIDILHKIFLLIE